jgi:hypothetical protein
MNAVPPSLTPGTTQGKWASLHDPAAVLAALAEVELKVADLDPPALPTSLSEGPAWRRELFDRAALDAAAALQPGIAGVASLAARGENSSSRAQALWAEFLAAREALLALAHQGEGSPREA